MKILVTNSITFKISILTANIVWDFGNEFVVISVMNVVQKFFILLQSPWNATDNEKSASIGATMTETWNFCYLSCS